MTDSPRLDDLSHVLHVVLAGRTRRFQCQRCGRWCEIPMLVGQVQGRFPAKCEDCEPDSQAWRRERETRPLRELIRVLSAELASERELRPHSWPPVDRRRAERYGRPGEEAFARAVRQVVASRGSDQALREAVLDVASVAQAYARALAEGRG